MGRDTGMVDHTDATLLFGVEGVEVQTVRLDTDGIRVVRLVASAEDQRPSGHHVGQRAAP
jgi:hypothetical protein